MTWRSSRRRLLFAADNGVCVAMYRRLSDRLRHDPRLSLYHSLYLKGTRGAGRSGHVDPRAYLREQELGGRIVHYRLGRVLPVDVCVTPSFNDRVQPRNARRTIQVFHGVSFKNYCIKEKARRYDRLYLPGPYHRRRYVESGLFAADDPRLVLTGLPKLDRLVDGSLERDAVLAGLGLDPALPTVLFAPTGDPGNALARFGEPILAELLEQRINLIVKPHDHPRRDPGCTVDWPARLRAVDHPRFHAGLGADVTPLLAAADLLLTDASSVAFEYTLLDRPIVFMHVPEILDGPRAARFDLGTWGRRGGDVVERPEELRRLVPRLLADPSEKSELRRAIAADLFHEPGRATENALRRLYAELELEPHEAVLGPDAAAPSSPATAPTSRRRRGRVVPVAVAAAALAGISVGLLRDSARAGAIGVAAAAETASDVARRLDDPAVWVDAADPARSLVICADTGSGLHVFDLAGRPVQDLPVGPLSHVDLRQGVGASGATVIATSDAIRREARFFTIDPSTRRLSPAAEFSVPVGVRPDGLSLYRSARTGRTSLFVLGARDEGGDTGWVEQYELDVGPDGIPTGARRVRAFDVGSATEGCVADDDHGVLYVAEEQVGIWRYPAEPDDPRPRVLVDSLGGAGGEGGRLRGTVEGVALLRLGDTDGYLIASNTGSDDFVVYRREGTNEYVDRFSLVGGDHVDEVSDTEGLDVAGGDLGGAFTEGVLVAQDTSDDAGGPNFKLVSWRSVADALRLR